MIYLIKRKLSSRYVSAALLEPCLPDPPHQDFLVFHFALCLLRVEFSQFRLSNFIQTHNLSNLFQSIELWKGDIRLKNKLLLL